jgi:hypothetical protein
MKKRIWPAFLAAIVISALPECAVAQVGPPSTVFRMVSGPALATPAEHLLLCAGNLGSAPIHVTLEIRNAVNGLIVAGPEQITLQPLTGPSPVVLPPDPCLEFPSSVSVSTAPAADTAATSTATAVRPLYIAFVSLNPQPLPPSTACLGGRHFDGDLVASLQIFTPGPVPTAIRYIPVLPPDPCIPIASIFAAGT